MPTTRPGRVWNAMLEGNERFVAGTPAHPRQDVERRESLAAGQEPVAAIFGCSPRSQSTLVCSRFFLSVMYTVPPPTLTS